MGRVRPKLVWRKAYELLEKFPDRFTTDFETNKKVIMEVTNITSKQLRNRIAGCIVHILKKRKRVS